MPTSILFFPDLVFVRKIYQIWEMVLMQKKFAAFSLLFIPVFVSAQKIQNKLQFEQGKEYAITVDLKNTIAQQAMGNAIDFTVSGKAAHSYKVTNTTDDNTTLRHSMQAISFDFDGMGQKRSFDSNKQKDLDGPFGKPVREMLARTYDMIVDKAGTTLMCMPEKIELAKQDDRLQIVTNMLKDLTSIIYPPKKGSPSFFQVLPDREVGIGETWTQSVTSAEERSSTEYTLTSITDTLITIDFKTRASSIVKAEMMGMETVTNMNSNAIGKIFLDPVTTLIRRKTMTIESNGNTEAMGNTMPINSKTIIEITVR